ncbi:MAG: glycoside hydrolase family 97 catalytic domain-containing protein [Bacteroidales bacterium]|nr:glycoside hydrolase family 97 catalytic domain-containing protein [Bacteroidales bacterium]
MKRALLTILLVILLPTFNVFGQKPNNGHKGAGVTLKCEKPQYLKAGDRIALISPAYYAPMEKIEKAAEVLRGWGIEPVIGPNVGKQYAGKYAGTIEERVSDLLWALNDTTIKAIICNRGGYGTIQYIDMIPLSEWASHPKWLMGFSDISTLHGLLTRAGVMSIHGTMSTFLCKGGLDETSLLARDLLMGKVPLYKLPAHPQNIEGTASGILVGGNICTIAPNTGSQADATAGQDIILFIEEVEEPMRNIDRQLSALILNGLLDRCRGVVLGEFTDCGNEMTYESVEAMLRERLEKYNIPLLCGFPGGHGDVNYPLVMGAPVTMEVRSDGATLLFNIEGNQTEVNCQSYPTVDSAEILISTGCNINKTKSKNYNLKSPDGKIETTIISDEGVLSYDIVYDGKTIMPMSMIGLDYTQGKKDFKKMTVKKITRRTIDETIASPFSRQASMQNRCNEITLHMKEGLSVVFRAYNEGVAYRYVWEGMPGVVTNEKMSCMFSDNTTATVPYVSKFDSTRFGNEPFILSNTWSPMSEKWAAFDPQYNSSFENQYTTKPLRDLDTRRLCFLPILLHCDNGVKICVTESSLSDYPGMYLRHFADGIMECKHAPVPAKVAQGGHNNLQLLVKEREKYIATMDKTKHFPWRIFMVGKNDIDIAMNNMSYLLGEASRVDDISWIKPGKVAWEWWNCLNITGVDFEAGFNNDTYKHYIDFASRYGIEYVILDEGWAVNKQADLFQVVPEIDLPMLVQYAKERNVGIILWAGYYAFDRDMEHVCRHYSEMGVKGFKIDFMDRDDQLVTDFYRRAAETCAKYHLVVDFHGAFKPAGFTRTYPNVLNFEGVFGLEQMKWAPATADQMRYDCEIPFIRQAAGPMDYTQGAMLNGGRWNYHPCWMQPMSQGTRCHQLALYIVLESPLNMLCDSPDNYDREPDYTRFVAEIPTVWDETRVLQGKVGEYIVTARRKGNTWYIGGITNWTERDIELNLSELGITKATIELYSDGANAHRKGSDYRHKTIDNNMPAITVHLAPGGGFVMKIN